MNYWFLMAGAAVSLAGMIFHGFIGGRRYIENVNRSDMEPLTKSLSVVSWHVFTIFLFTSALALVCIAYNSELRQVSYPIIGVNLLGTALFILLGISNNKALIKMPGAYLMGGTAALAWLGIN